MRRILSFLALGALAACAQQPDAIAPVAMPGGAYSGMSCAAAAAERQAVAARLSGLEAQQRSAAAGDAVGVFLIGVPWSSLTGGDKAGLIAAEKGAALALDARLRSCAG